MSVDLYNWPAEYLVKSSDGRVPDYKVDLDTYDGNGFCDCPHFKFKFAPLLDRGARPGDSTRCKHIRQAMLLFAALILENLYDTKKSTLETVRRRQIGEGINTTKIHQKSLN